MTTVDTPCERQSPPLALLEYHAFALSRLLLEEDVTAAVGFDASNWVILAAGLSKVSIITTGLDPQDSYCPNIYEEERGANASAVATELTRLLFLWGAAELLMKKAPLPRRERRESEVKRMIRMVDEKVLELVHHRCSANNLFAALDHSDSSDLKNAARKAREFDAGVIGQGTLAAYNVRNCLAHGSIPWPDDTESSLRQGLRVGRLASRVLLFAVQQLMICSIPDTAETSDWPDDEDEIRVRPVKRVLVRSHLAEPPAS